MTPGLQSPATHYSSRSAAVTAPVLPVVAVAEHPLGDLTPFLARLNEVYVGDTQTVMTVSG